MVNDLDYQGIEFPVSNKDLDKKNNICINVFCYENNLVFAVYISDERIESCMDLLLIKNNNKSLYVDFKDFNRFMCNKTKNKNKKRFCNL